LSDLVDSLVAGEGSAAILEGMAGIGKTALVEELARRGRAAGCAVASGAGDELDRITPMGALLAALRSGEPPILTAGDIRGLQASDQRLAMLDRLHEVLELEAARRPILVVLDDLQWVDHATLLAVGSLPQRLFSLPVMWIVARRTAPSSPTLDVALQRLRTGGATTVALRPLDDEAVTAMTEDLLGCTPSRPLLTELAKAGGNPFYLSQLIACLTSAGAIDVRGDAARLRAEAPVTDLTETIMTHVEMLSDGARRIVEVGSILGRQFPLGTVADLLARPAGQLLDAVTECRRAEILADDGVMLAFNHELLRQAVYESVPGSVRVALHCDAAKVLTAEGGSAVEVAPHLARSARAGDVVALDGLRDAATALVGSNPDAAADLALRAFELTPVRDPRRAQTGALAADALGWAARLAEAEAVHDAVMADGEVPVVTEAIMELGIRRSWEIAASRPYRRPIPPRLLSDPDLPTSLRVCLMALEAGPRMFEDMPALAPRLDQIRTEADASGADFAIAAVWIHQLMAKVFLGHLQPALDDARAAVSWADEARGNEAYHQRAQGMHFAAAHALYAMDRLDEALDAFQVADRAADEVGATNMIAINEAVRGAVLRAAGRLGDAAAAAESARQLSEDLKLWRTLGESLRVLGEVAVARGDLEAAATYARDVAPVLDDRTTTLNASWMPAVLADAEGDPARALALVEPALDLLEAGNMLIVMPDGDRLPLIVSLACRAGRRDRAEMVAGKAAWLADRNPEVPLLAGGASHCRGILEQSPKMVADAVALLRGSQRPLALAAALEDLGTMLLSDDDGSHGDAVGALDEAYDIYIRCEAQRHAARVRRLLRGAGVVKRTAAIARPTAGWESLTDAEMNVARIVAEGHTSRTVADRMYLSVNTVNTHLRHIFTKLGVRTRVELTRVVLSHGDARPTDHQF
jgi:DNA-binding CsgD family transcriptional regulator/tetratricopeptide (TPR) repeat protein